jgi:hypothetical protein
MPELQRSWHFFRGTERSEWLFNVAASFRKTGCCTVMKPMSGLRLDIAIQASEMSDCKVNLERMLTPEGDQLLKSGEPTRLLEER